jgi:hypothetical protein
MAGPQGLHVVGGVWVVAAVMARAAWGRVDRRLAQGRRANQHTLPAPRL